MIPKLIHRIWLGGQPMPEEFVAWGETWERLHPDWKVLLWTEKNLPTSAFPDLMERALFLKTRANIARYELLAQLGGIYVDTDFECLKNLEPLIEGASWFAAIQQRSPESVANGLFGTAPKHPIMVELLAGLKEAFDLDSFLNLGPAYFTKVVQRHRDRDGVRLFGPELFYPYLWSELHRRGEKFPDAYAVHHWASQWYEPSKKHLY